MVMVLSKEEGPMDFKGPMDFRNPLGLDSEKLLDPSRSITRSLIALRASPSSHVLDSEQLPR